jgi:hypothetical protein
MQNLLAVATTVVRLGETNTGRHTDIPHGKSFIAIRQAATLLQELP